MFVGCQVSDRCPLGCWYVFVKLYVFFYYFENKQLRSTRRHFSAIQHWVLVKHTNLHLIMVIFTDRSRQCFLWGSVLLFVFVFAILWCLFLAGLWSPVWKIADLLAFLYVMFSCVLSLSRSVALVRQVWYLIVSISDICLLPFFQPVCFTNCMYLINSLIFLTNSTISLHLSWFIIWLPPPVKRIKELI